MAELHRFQDDAKTPEGKRKPIVAKELDDNFRQVRTEIGSSLSSLLKIEQSYPQPDKISISVPAAGTFYPYIRNGAFVLLEIPSSGTFYVKFVDGSATTIERDTCS